MLSSVLWCHSLESDANLSSGHSPPPTALNCLFADECTPPEVWLAAREPQPAHPRTTSAVWRRQMQHITVEAPSKSVAARSPRARPDAKPSPAQSPYHPLDGLSPAELRSAAEAVKEYAAQLGVAPVRFNSVHIQASRALAPGPHHTHNPPLNSVLVLCNSTHQCQRFFGWGLRHARG